MNQKGMGIRMKKILAFVLLFALVFAFSACQTESDTESGNTSSGKPNTSSAASTGHTSLGGTTSKEVSKDASSAGDVSDPGSKPEFISQFVSAAPLDPSKPVSASSPDSIRLTAIDASETSEGDIVLYTSDYGDSVTVPETFAVAEFTYRQDIFGYAKTAFHQPGEVAEADVPDDGFLILADQSQKQYVDRLKAIKDDASVFPYGLHLPEVDYEIKKVSAAPKIDGEFHESEWKDYRIDKIDAENELWSYAQFEKDTYFATADYYVGYDNDYLYLCVVVNSAYHYCPISKDKPNDMWQYECIQVKVSSESPAGEYITQNFDHVSNNKAVKEGVVRSYGFAANDDNETCFYESGFQTTFGGQAGCSRDDDEQLTVYEVAIPWAEFEITPEAGMELGLTFSVNSTSEEDFNKGVWKNITYRCGGGVIGRNDWSKIPVITLR